jgi:hypothetical protein
LQYWLLLNKVIVLFLHYHVIPNKGVFDMKFTEMEKYQDLDDLECSSIQGGQLSKNEKAGAYGLGAGALLGGAGYAAAHSDRAMRGLLGAGAVADVGFAGAAIARLV